ncbi:fructokinase [Massilia horti]|uniref:Fructokinase n=2 Tax=Massilia horti TaxID=2562153 RepID=A0A4Y9SSE0_9BURK|nr:fructokinase [Massilia horti]
MQQRDKTVVVCGEALVEETGGEQVAGGAPFNVARHLAAFMVPQLMITRIGSDLNGALVRGEFERFAMTEAGLQFDQLEETGRAVLERSPGGVRLTVLPNQAYDYIDEDEALAALSAEEPCAFYFGTLAQRSARTRTTLEALLQACVAPRFLDLNLRESAIDERIVFRSLHLADIVKVNEAELQMLFKWYFQIEPSAPPLPPDEVRAACRALVDMFSLQALIVTLGHRGSVYFGEDDEVIANRDNPAPPFVIDTAGAGDAFAAIFLLGLVREWPLETTLARANEFAGAICAIPGAVPRDLGFYDKWMARWRAA